MEINKICPSILDVPFSDWKTWLKIIKKHGINMIHYDVMDGHFVPVISFGNHNLKLINQLKMKISVHFMVNFKFFSENKLINFLNYYQPFVQELIFHYESLTPEQISSTRNYCKNHHLKWGLALKMQTPVENIAKIFSNLDNLLLLAVEPGFGGQKMTNEIFEKINIANKLRNLTKNPCKITIDGGIKPNFLVKSLIEKVDYLVIGSYLAKNPEINLMKFQKILNNL